MKAETVEYLAAAGLKVIDLGLEAASITQVGAMKKSKDPERYLRSASELLSACKANGVWVKANILIYGGETAKTLAETRDWLDSHSDMIKGVSVGPVIVFGPPGTTGAFMNDLQKLGARAVDPESAALTGITRIHPSKDIDAEAAESISLDLSRRYMDENAYFDLKAFSYYPRNYTRHDFDADVRASDAAQLPFRRADKTDAVSARP